MGQVLKRVLKKPGPTHKNTTQWCIPASLGVLDCDFKTDSEGILKTHMVKSYGEEKEKDFTCPKCNKSFDGQHLLSKHVKSATCDMAKDFECNICKPSKWFKIRSSMVTHMKTYYTGEITKLSCPQCKIFLATRRAWTSMISYTGE